jgi:hypothetical protein
MKPKILRYSNNDGIDFLAIRKNGYIIDIACSSKNYGMLSEKGVPGPIYNPFSKSNIWDNIIEIQVQDLALYTHWPVHTKEFWDLLRISMASRLLIS